MQYDLSYFFLIVPLIFLLLAFYITYNVKPEKLALFLFCILMCGLFPLVYTSLSEKMIYDNVYKNMDTIPADINRIKTKHPDALEQKIFISNYLESVYGLRVKSIDGNCITFYNLRIDV